MRHIVRPKRLLALLASLALLAATATCSTPQRVAEEAPADTPTLKLMTFNVNFGIAGDPETIEVIGRERADLVLLQETTRGWERAIREQLGEQYPHMIFLHDTAAGGLAVLSTRPVTVAETIESPVGWFPAWRLIADTALGELQLLNLHLRPPISEDGSWVKGYLTTDGARQEEIRRYFKSLDPALPTIIAGDMNEAASGDVVAFLREQGMESALEEFEPGATTWRWPLPVGSLTWQLDHVAYQTKRLRPLNAQVRRAGNSDHFPVVTVFVKP